MLEQLFNEADRRIDPLWIVKTYFNAMEGTSFPCVLSELLEGTSSGSEYVMCEFPCENEDDLFEGVRFRFLEEEIIVSEEVFKKYFKIAAKRYIELNPKRADEVQKVLEKLS
jgi:hypothetical protein